MSKVSLIKTTTCWGVTFEGNGDILGQTGRVAATSLDAMRWARNFLGRPVSDLPVEYWTVGDREADRTIFYARVERLLYVDGKFKATLENIGDLISMSWTGGNI